MFASQLPLPLQRTLSDPCPIIPRLLDPSNSIIHSKTDESVLYASTDTAIEKQITLAVSTLTTPTCEVIEIPNTPSRTETQGLPAVEINSQTSTTSPRVRFSSPVVDKIYTYGDDDPNSFEIEEVLDEDVVLPSIAPDSEHNSTTACIVKQLQPLPPHAERDIHVQGKFSFRKGVRIRDYIPVQAVPWNEMLRKAPQFQCRDGFEEHEVWMGRPRLFNRPSTTQIKHKSEVAAPKTTNYKRRVIYDPVRDSKRISLPSFGELELLPPSIEPPNSSYTPPMSPIAPGN